MPPPRNPPPPLYIGWIGRDNLGDEAVMAAFRMRFPGMGTLPAASLLMLRAGALLGRCGWTAPGRRYRTRHLRRCLARYQGSPVVLGGGTLIGANSVLPVVREAVAGGFPLYTFGTGVLDWHCQADRHGGSAAPDDVLEQWKDALRAFRRISVRGVLSRNLLQAIGIESEVVGDPAVLFTEAAPLPVREERILGINLGLARSLLWGGNEQAVAGKLKATADRLMAQGWDVRVFSVYVKDTPFLREWIKSLEHPGHVRLVEEYRDPRKFMSQVQECSVFAGMKLHATMLAFIAQVPSLMIEYRPKCLDFMTTMESESRNFRCDRLDERVLEETVIQLFDNREAVRAQQHQVALQFQRKLQEYCAGLEREFQ